MSQDNLKKKFEELQSRAQKVNESAIKLNTQIENSQENLKKVKDIALKKFKIDDLEGLQNKADEWIKENEEKVDTLENEVVSLEKKVAEKTNLVKQVQTN